MGHTRKWWTPRDEKQRRMFEQYRDDVRSAISTFKDGVCMGSVASLLRECLGEDIPYQEMGFRTLSEFFFHMDDIFEIRMYNKFVLDSPKKFIFLKQSALNDSSSHIRSLVSGQASGSRRKGEPKASYNNTVRVDSDSILPASRAGEMGQSRGPFQPRSNPYAMNSGNTSGNAYNARPNFQRSSVPQNMNFNNGYQYTQKQRFVVPPKATPTTYKYPGSIQGNVKPNPLMSNVVNLSTSVKSWPKDVYGVPPLIYKTVDMVDSGPISKPTFDLGSGAGVSTQQAKTPTPIINRQIHVGTLPRGPSIPSQNPAQVVEDNVNPRLKSKQSPLSQPETNSKNPFDMSTLQQTVGLEANVPPRRPMAPDESNQGKVYRNIDSYMAATASAAGKTTGLHYAYNGPKTYNDYDGGGVHRTTGEYRVARMAQAVSNCLDNDDDEDLYEDEFGFDDKSSDEYEVTLPVVNTAPKEVQKPVVVGKEKTDQHQEKAAIVAENPVETGKNETILAEQPFGTYTLPPAGDQYLNPYDGIEFEQILPGKANLRIVQVNNALDFLVNNAAEAKKLSNMTDEMTGWYNFQMKRNILPPPTRKLDKGVYSGYCEETKTWNRVQILLPEEIGQNGMITALFCDYGILKEIHSDKIQFLIKAYCELPRQAFFAEAEFAKVGSPNYGQRQMLQEKLHSAVGKTLEVNITNVLTTESIVPLLTVEFEFN